MSTPTSFNKSRGSIFDYLAKGNERVLLLDYDGTIAPFSLDRQQAFPYAIVPQLLRQIMAKCRTRLIVISDRTAHELIPLLGLDPPPEIWGNYGLERIHADGRYEQAEVTKQLFEAVAKAKADLEREGLAQYIEAKLTSVAVHWRGVPTSAILEIRAKTLRVLGPLAFQTEISMVEFDGGIAIRPRWANKGNAVRAVLSEIAPDMPVAYVGDDMTDEDAFRALNGRGLTVRVGPRERFTAAQMWLRHSEDLISFFKDWIRACGGDQ